MMETTKSKKPSSYRGSTFRWPVRFNISVCVSLSALAHVLMFLYGEMHDRISTVKYTDIDYFVFTDASRLLASGKSPFDRPTYRYTPLLSWILYPGIELYQGFGKLVFCLCDVLVGFLIYRIVRRQNVNIVKSLYCASAWFFNPMAIVVSSRGNFESLVACLVLATTLSVMNKKAKCAGLLYGLSVHVKIYPVTYLMSFYFAMDLQYSRISKHNTWLQQLRLLLWPSEKRVVFSVFAVLGFALPTYFSYLLYGDKYLQESFLYHLKRRDVKHNFSPYFYMLYLNSDRPGLFLSLVSFMPQVVLILLASCRYCRPVDLPFSIFLQTYAFVSFNKVCTSQYFLWFLSLLPLVVPMLKFKSRDLYATLSLWVCSQVVWLYAAYGLEFLGVDTFVYLWIASLIFFTSNIIAMHFFIRSYV